jgi:hypothetical protein
MLIKVNDYEVSYEETDEIKQAVFDRVMKYFVKHEAFHGEVIMQMDDPIIDAPTVLADIADDIIKFKVYDNIYKKD